LPPRPHPKEFAAPPALYSARRINSPLRRIAEKLIVSAQRWRIRQQFKAKLGYAGNFEHPSTYQEKIQFRKLYGNHALYALLTDKFRVREYVAAKIGAQHLIPLLGAYDRLHESDFDPLPNQFIIKANHGCKWNRVVLDKSTLDVRATVRYFNKLCRRRYGWRGCERHYNFIRPKIVIEQLLRNESGGAPWDFNFLCFNGPDGFRYDYTIESPAESGAGAAISSDGEILFIDKVSEQEVAANAHPANFDTMVSVAKALSADFDFMRVDLYSVSGQVYFGELTCTPRRGYGAIPNKALQKRRDEMCHLDFDNPRLYRPHTV
jgi:TupA-like ATPgrasp